MDYDLNIDVKADGSVAVRQIQRVERSLEKTGKEAERTSRRVQQGFSNVGRTLTRAGAAASVLSAAIVAIGSASARASLNFSRAFTQINTLVGVGREELAAYRQEIARIGSASGIGPQELAEALFAVTSAGIRGRTAIETLNAAANAASIGLGNTRDVALAAGAAVTAYGEANLSASDAVDILVGTVEQGNLSAEEVATSLGSVIGIAAELGVTFEEVGGFVASYSRLGISAAEATTSLRSTLAGLLRPTTDAEQAFERAGISVAQFRENVESEGFTAAFRDLINSAQEAGVEVSDLIPNVRGLSGVLGVFGQEGNAAEETVRNVAAAVGTLDERVSAALELDPGQRLNQIRSSLESLRIEIGDSFIPVLVEVLEGVESLATGFLELDDDTQQLILKIAGIAAVAGPAIVALGALSASIAAIIGLLAGPAGLIIGLISFQTAAIGVGFALGSTLNNLIDFDREVNTLKDSLADLTPEADRLSQRVFQIREAFLLDEIEQAKNEIVELGNAGDQFSTVVRDELIGRLQQLGAELQLNEERAKKFVDRLRSQGIEPKSIFQVIFEQTESAARLAIEAIEDYEAALPSIDLTEPAEIEILGVQSAEEQRAAIDQLGQEFDQLVQQFEGPVQSAYRQLIESQDLLTLALANGLIDAEEYEQVQDQLNQRFIESIPLYDQMLSRLPPLVQQMLGLANATGQAASATGFLSQIGLNFSQSILNGNGLRDSLSGALTGFAGSGIGSILEETFATAAEEGLSAAFDSEGFKKNSTEGFALALGQAVEGNIGQAALTAIGNVIGGPIGAIIGNVIGDILFGESVPKFQVRGSNAARATDEGTDEIRNAGLGEIQFAFREIEATARRQVIEGFSAFDSALADIIAGTGLLDDATTALERFGVSSRSDGEDIANLLQLRLDAILGVFPPFIDALVQEGITLEDQLQRFADIISISQRFALGQTLGLTGDGFSGPGAGGAGGGGLIPPGGGVGPSPAPPGVVEPEKIADASKELILFNDVLEGTGDAADLSSPALLQTLEITNELSRSSETLAQTYDRLFRTTELLDRSIAIIGSSFEGTREDLIRFGDSLVQAFGDNLGRVTEIIDRVLNRVFTEAQRLEFEAAQNAQSAQDLLSSIGVAFDGDLFTDSALSELLDLFNSGVLGPQSSAILLEAIDAIINVIEAEEQLAEARQEAAEAANGLSEAESLLLDVNDAIFELSRSEYRVRLRDINRETADLIAQNEALGGSEQTLGRIRQLQQLQIQQLASAVLSNIEDIVAQLFGNGARDPFAQVDPVSQVNDIAEANRRRYERELRAIERISEFVDELLLSSLSPFNPQQRVNEARTQLDATFAAAEAGDLDAIEALPDVVQQYLSELQDFTGGVGDYPQIFADVIARLEQIQSTAPSVPPTELPPTTGVVQQVGQDIVNELTELQRLQLSTQLVDQIGLLSRLTGDSPAEIANRLGIPIDELIRTIEGELPAATGAALEEYFNNLVTTFDESLQEVGSLADTNTILEDILAELRDQTARINLRSPPGVGDADDDNGLDPLRGMATGGFVNGPSRILAGEAGRELILPNNVTEFFARVGVPVNTNRGDSPQVVALLSRIANSIENGNSDQFAIANALNDVADSMKERRREEDRFAIRGEPSRGGRCGG